MPVGVVVYTDEAKFEAYNLIPGKGKIEGDWGPRSDLAAEETWKVYETCLPRGERWKRYWARREGLLWAAFVAAVGGLVGATLTTMLG